jgi:prepilin peptidase CpaA
MNLLLVRSLLWASCLSLVAVSAVTDLRNRIIPNRIVILIGAVGLAFCVVSRPGFGWPSVLIAFIVFLGLGTLTHYKFLGGGDTKLITVLTLLVPPGQVGMLLTDIMLAGGVLSATYLGACRALRGTPKGGAVAATAFNRFFYNERERIISGQSVPYALAILAGLTFYMANELYQCSFAISCSL